MTDDVKACTGLQDTDVIAYEALVGNENTAYVHARAGEDVLPLVVLVHGSHTHPENYSRYADLLAAYGFVVVAPEEVREVFGSTAHYPQQAFITWVLEWARAENVRADSPLRGRIGEQVFLTGHSMGGGATLGIVSDFAQPGLCVDPWERPAELLAAVVHGTHNIPPPRTGDPMPVDNRVPLAFIQGTADGVVTLDQSRRSFDAVHGVAPRMFVELDGANHFFLTDSSSPDGANADPSTTVTLDQDAAVASAARWTARWFHAARGEQESLAALRSGPNADEPHVTVELREV